MRHISVRLALAAIAICIADSTSADSKLPSEKQSGEALSNVLRGFCTNCHGGDEPRAGLTFPLIEQTPGSDFKPAVWKRVLDQLESGAMPPDDAPQPSLEQRRSAISQIEDILKAAGAAIDRGRWLDPSRGNWVSHEALFSNQNTTQTATRGRLWRLTGPAYEEFIQSLNKRYWLGFRTYGHHKVRAPWEFPSQSGFRDYSAQHRIGEPEIEHHLRNAARVARAMIQRLPKSRDEDMQPLKALLNNEEPPTGEQLQLVSASAVRGILGRSATDVEHERYTAFLESSLKRLETSAALEQLLIAVLFHPEVVYRIELPVEGEPRTILPARDLARAIAYALTDREPDEQLMAAASDGRLAQKSQVRNQVSRILKDESIDKPRLLRFFQEYFGYTAAIDVFKDSDTRKAAGFRGKNDWHPNFFVSDADRLVLWILKHDSNVLYELLTTSKTFAVTGNTKQAEGVKKNATKPFSLFAQTALDIYELDIERKDWSDERPFDMPREHRRGLLTHPSWLIAHSTNFDNHAIHRGRWIRERLLGGRIPDLPVTVDAQLPDEPDKTLRQRMHVTREEYCWQCHQQMDPLGLPFEQFDHFGQYRTTELDRPVDTTGAVTDSRDARADGSVRDPFELMEKLATSERVEQVFVRHVFRYFLGRNETLADGPVLVAAHKAYKDNDGSMNALITSLLTSDAFLYRTSSTPARSASK